MVLATAVILFTAACNRSNPAEGATQPQPAPTAKSTQPAASQPAAVSDVPIDPMKEMPPHSLTTNATLEAEKEATVMIDGRSDLFSAGAASADPDRGGVMPSVITLVAGEGFITFAKVRGKAGCGAGNPAGPDGGDCAGGDTIIESAGHVSGITDHNHSQFLIGVFLGDKPGAPPKGLDFSKGAKGESFAELAPALGQSFYIGDGMTGEGTGDTQRFSIPKGATHLFLGYADASGFQGPPSSYGDNTGGLSVSLTQHLPSAPAADKK